MTFFGCPTDINTSTVAVLKSHYTFAFRCGRITRHRKKRFRCIACCLIWLVILKSSWSLHIGLWDVRWKFKGWNRETYLSLSQERKGSRCSFSERKESLIVFILLIASSQVDAVIHKQTQWQTTDSRVWICWLIQIIYQTLPHFNHHLVYIIYQHVATLFTKRTLYVFN